MSVRKIEQFWSISISFLIFQEFFDRHPEVLIHFEKFRAIEIDGVRVSDALRMHASRVLAIVEDIVENTGNPDKIRSLMQDLGRHHYKRVSLTMPRYNMEPFQTNFILCCLQEKAITKKVQHKKN
jgi:hypothetical protein